MQRIVRKRHAYLIGAAIVLVGPALLSQPASARFVQQGPKLVATEVYAAQGWSVALSANGNTAIVGAPQIGNGGGGRVGVHPAATAFGSTRGV